MHCIVILMCGVIASILGKDSVVDLPLFQKALKRLHHRGPNGWGISKHSIAWGEVTLGMTRLAIVDRRPLPTPFTLPHLGLSVSFNGEIYNWRELRAELFNGMPWESNCDTEVLLRGWRKWGTNVLQRLNGMFAFVLVDEQTHEVFVARDRAGEKPLYYAPTKNGVHFASEIKGLPIELEPKISQDAQVLEFDCLRETSFQGVYSVAPGEYMLFNGDDPITHTWWSFPDTNSNLSYLTAKEELTTTLVDAIKIRADLCEVPVALQLSGGLDSSIIRAVTNYPAYTVTFPTQGYDNLTAAAFMGASTPVTFTRKDLERDLVQIAYHLDTPATWTAVCQWFMFKRMAADGIVVTLSGEGADELFHGYSRYKFLWHLEQTRKDPQLKGYAATFRKLHGTDTEILARLLDRSDGADRDYAHFLVERYSGSGDLVSRAARLDWHTTMQVLLRMPDRMSSAFSMENRAPFLDHRLIELSARIPTNLKIDGAWTKAILRNVAEALGVPEEITRAPHKTGLALPWSRWYQNSSNPYCRKGFRDQMENAWRTAFPSTG